MACITTESKSQEFYYRRFRSGQPPPSTVHGPVGLGFHISSISKNALMPVGEDGAVDAYREQSLVLQAGLLSKLLTWPMKGSLFVSGFFSAWLSIKAVAGTGAGLAMGCFIARDNPPSAGFTKGESFARSNCAWFAKPIVWLWASGGVALPEGDVL